MKKAEQPAPKKAAQATESSKQGMAKKAENETRQAEKKATKKSEEMGDAEDGEVQGENPATPVPQATITPVSSSGE